MVWEIVFMLVVLKIPIAYLCAVVWWAVRAEPEADSPPEGARVVPLDDTPLAPERGAWKRPASRQPRHGPGPYRRPAPARAREVRIGASR